MKRQIVKFAHNNKTKQFWVEHTDGYRRESTEDENVSLWFVWLSSMGAKKETEGDLTVFTFSPQFLKENHLYTLVKRTEEERRKYIEENS